MDNPAIDALSFKDRVGEAVASAAGGLGLVVVELRVDDQRPPADVRGSAVKRHRVTEDLGSKRPSRSTY